MPATEYDLVLVGATGFTGRLIAAYLAGHAPAGFRWALAGRDERKLGDLRGALAAADPALTDLPLLHAESADRRSLHRLAEQSRVVASTVGPYLQHGEPLVAACAETGTDYLDLTGEPEFVDTMYLRYDQAARRSGARLVHACGFDSMPFDLGAYFTVRQLPFDAAVSIRSYLEVSGRASGGTVASALTAFSRARANVAAGRARRRAEHSGGTRRVRSGPGRAHRSDVPAGWALPMPTIDPQIVGRSARAVDRYGPDFRYEQHVCVPRARTAAGLAVGAAGLLALAQLPPARNAVLKRIPAGTGPSAEQRAKHWFRVTFVGTGGGRQVVTRVSGGDPGYDATASMFGEAGLALATDELPMAAGQQTTVSAMGDALLRRLDGTGLRFEVLETS